MEGVNQNKRIQVEEESDYRPWDELIPDALGLIFKGLSLVEVLQVIPRVCKSWCKVVEGPYFWKRIDIDEWCSRNQYMIDKIDRMIRMLITRSSGSLQELSVSCVEFRGLFSFIAEHAGSLQTLAIKRSSLSDSIVEQIAGNLSSITSLDVSYCYGIGTPAFEAIGRSCKMLTSLSWKIDPSYSADMSSHEDDARAIARTMPKLKHLNVAYLNINTKVVVEILSSCPNLESLDIRGCSEVMLDLKLLEEKYPKVKVLGPMDGEYSDTETDSDEERWRADCWPDELMYGEDKSWLIDYATEMLYGDQMDYLLEEELEEGDYGNICQCCYDY